MMQYGSLDGAKETLVGIRKYLKMLGNSGTFSLYRDVGSVQLDISNRIKLSTFTPTHIHYTITPEDVILLRFATPYPRVHFLNMLSGTLTEVAMVSLERLEFKIDGLPDGFLEVRS